MRKYRKNFFYLGLSLFFHTVLILSLAGIDSGRQTLKNLPRQNQWVELISDQSAKKNQIVEQEKNPIRETAPEKNYRLSQSNRKPLKETVAEKSGTFKNANKKTELLNSLKPRLFSVDPKPIPSVKNRDTNPVRAVEEPSNSGSLSGSSEDRRNTKVVELSDSLGQKGSVAFRAMINKKAQTTADLLNRKTAQSPVVSQTDDYLKAVAPGAKTLLRTREFVYYSYFSRIKKKLRQYWEPKVKMEIKRTSVKGRKIARAGERITCLSVILNSSGELIKVRLKISSGFTELDHSAIRAFKEASPFPNPPKGLVNQYGEIKINWNFVLES